MNNNVEDVYGDMPVLSPEEPMEIEENENAVMEEDNEQNENVTPQSVSAICETPKLPGKVRIIQIGRGKYRRQLIAGATARRLFGGGEPSVQKLKPIPEMNPKDFEGPGWECLNIAEANAGRYYHAIRIKGQFLLLNILTDELEFNYPENRLRSLFGKMAIWLQKSANEKGYKPQHYIISFKSELLDHSITFHLGNMNADAAESILHFFMKIDQSGMLKHKKESITTQQFEVDITALELRKVRHHEPTEIGKKRQRRHPGAGGRHKTDNFKYNINLDAIISLQNEDNYCLFRSLELARNKKMMTTRQFRGYIENEKRQKHDIDRLLLRTGIPRNLEAYDIKDWGDKIQEDYDREYGKDRFRIYAFGSVGNFKPFWASKKAEYQEELCVLFWEEENEDDHGHYDPVIYPGQLLGGSKQYCFACEMPYQSVFEHSWNCAFKCRDCGRVGPQFHGGCQPDGNPEIKCPDCKKTFKSGNCFDYHKEFTIGKRKLRSVCEKHTMCEKCGDKYVVKSQTKKGNVHICGRRHCHKCGAYHLPRPCYIQPYELPEGQDFRLVVADCETTQDFQPDRRKAEFQHEVNFVGAKVTCNLCMANKKLGKPVDENCRICGKDRTFAWSVADFNETKVDSKHITEDPRRDFLEWALKFWKKQKPKKARRKQDGEKGRRVRPQRGGNPFIDMEAGDVDAYDSSEDQDVLQLLGQNYTIDDEGIEGREQSDDDDDDEDDDSDESEREDDIEEMDDDGPRNAVSGFMERIESQNDEEAENLDDAPGPSNAFRNSPGPSNHQGSPETTVPNDQIDLLLAEKAKKWKEIFDIMVEKGLWKSWEEQEAAKKAEEEAKRVEEEEKKKAEEEAKKKKEQRKLNREVPTYIYTHYGQKYDNVLFESELLRMGYCPKTIRQGKKIYQMEVRRRGVITPTIFRDSYHLIPLKLEAFVPTFKLEIPGIEGKQYFPYKYNTRANMDKVLNHLPPKNDYCYKSMPRKKAKIFEEHYEAHKNTRFILKEVIADYCMSDVEILYHGLIKMREIFMEATGLDITRSITASGACMKFFRKFLQPLQLAMTPHLGYEKHDRSSAIARKHMKWLAHKNGLNIQDADSLMGEKRVGKWKVDGYIHRDNEEGGPIAIEVYGCYWHGCRRCYPHLREEHFLGGKNVGKLWERDMARSKEIREKSHLWVIWECEIYNQLDDNPEMEAFFDNLEDSGPINLRDAFMGGRTGPEWLFAKAPAVPTPEEIRQKFGQGLNHDAVRRIQRRMHRTIKVKDVKSLYPAINFGTEYPIGHPKVEIVDADVNWTKAEDIPKMQHLLKVFVVPPRHVDISVLPNRYGNDTRLLFSLCRNCALKYKDGHYDNNYSCPHIDDKERGHIGTYTSIELGMALDAGYRVTRHYRSYEWHNLDETFSDELFKPYIRAIMKLKYIAEGWPAAITELPEAEQEQAKIRYVEEANERYGIEFTVDDVQSNPGMKFISKLLLNSLWGRFALRNRLSSTVFCNNDTEIAKYLNNEKLDIEDCKQITERTWMIVYKVKDVYVREHSCSNLILALWTTAAARVHLLKQMQMILKRPDVRILYYDTDSVFYEYDTELGDPMENGQHLGEMTDQYPDHEILEFVCLAPKFYSLRMVNKKTGKREYETKAKGFTLDCENADALNHATMKAQLMDFLQGEQVQPIVCNYPNNNFRITDKGDIFTVPLVKLARPVINKGVVREDGRVMPFGWSKYEDPLNREYYGRWDIKDPNNMDRIERSIYED